MPYFEGALPENTLRLLGVRSEITVENLLALLRQQSGNDKANPDMVERIYSQLAASPRNCSLKPYGLTFSNEALIFAKDGHGAIRWYKSDDCVWGMPPQCLATLCLFICPVSQTPRLLRREARCQAAG